jgi:hypothetical protein
MKKFIALIVLTGWIFTSFAQKYTPNNGYFISDGLRARTGLGLPVFRDTTAASGKFDSLGTTIYWQSKIWVKDTLQWRSVGGGSIPRYVNPMVRTETGASTFNPIDLNDYIISCEPNNLILNLVLPDLRTMPAGEERMYLVKLEDTYPNYNVVVYPNSGDDSQIIGTDAPGSPFSITTTGGWAIFYSKSPNAWAVVSGDLPSTLQQVLDAGNSANNQSLSLVTTSQTISLAPASGVYSFTNNLGNEASVGARNAAGRKARAELHATSVTSGQGNIGYLMLTGDSSILKTTGDLTFNQVDTTFFGVFLNKKYATIHTDGRMTGADGTGMNDFVTVGQISLQVRSTSANTTLATNNEYILNCANTSTITVTLPSGTNKKVYLIKRTNASTATVTIAQQSGETIDGSSSNLIIPTAGEYVYIYSDGTGKWFTANPNL